MLAAAKAQSWEEFLEMDKAALPLEQALIQQHPARAGEDIDETSRILIAEIVSDQQEMLKIVSAHQEDLKSQLVTGVTVRKLGKFYGV